jgi:hypothetical protein
MPTIMPIPIHSVDGPDWVSILTLIVAAATLLATVIYGALTLRSANADYALTFNSWKEAQRQAAMHPDLSLVFLVPQQSDTLSVPKEIRRVPMSQTRVELKNRVYIVNTGDKVASDVTVRIMLPGYFDQNVLPVEAANPGTVSVTERHEQGRFFFVQHNYSSQTEDTIRVGSVPTGGDPIPVGVMELLAEYGKGNQIPWEIRHSEGVVSGQLHIHWQ